MRARILAWLIFACVFIGFFNVAADVPPDLYDEPENFAGNDSGIDGPLSWLADWTMDDPRLSQPVYNDSLYEHMPVVASDGVVLDVWVRRPVTPDGVTVPTILRLSPYLGDSLPDGGGLPLVQDNYVGRGYAIAAASVRGTGYSEGCFNMQGERDVLDASEIVDAIASEAWSNGKVGAIGLSWDGTTLNAALLGGNPALATVVPVSAITDWYRWHFLNGVPFAYAGYSFNLYSWAQLSANPHLSKPPTHDDFERIGTRWCDGVVTLQASGAMSGITGVRNEWWDERDFTRKVDQIDPGIGVLLAHGHQDMLVRNDHLVEWMTALREQGVETRTLIGQWEHGYPDHNFNPNLLRPMYNFPAWDVTMLRWFDHWLKGKETGILDMPDVLTQDPTGAWHAHDALKPSHGSATRFFLTPDGSLAPEPASGFSFFMDNGLPPLPPQPVPHAVRFTSAPLEQDLRFVGEGHLNLLVTHTAPTGHVAVTLYNVNGDLWEPINIGFSNYNLRNSMHDFDPVVPGQVFEVQVPILPYNALIPAGHRLGITVGSQATYDPGYTVTATHPLPVASGGVTSIHHAESTYLDLWTFTGEGEHYVT